MSSSADPSLRSRPIAPAEGAAWRTFVRRWGISLTSLASGLVTLLIFRRGVPHVGWIIGYVLGLWLLFAVLTQTRDALLAGGRHLVVAAGDYTIQTLYHGLLLFVLPGYFASTTFDGITVVFFAVLVAASLLTYSRKADFPPDAQGRWTVDVVTASGQLIGRLRFRVDG